jgi:hypothetical protein
LEVRSMEGLGVTMSTGALGNMGGSQRGSRAWGRVYGSSCSMN